MTALHSPTVRPAAIAAPATALCAVAVGHATQDLQDVSPLRQYGMSGCATAVIVEPATGNRSAGADPRRDCHAIAC